MDGVPEEYYKNKNSGPNFCSKNVGKARLPVKRGMGSMWNGFHVRLGMRSNIWVKPLKYVPQSTAVKYQIESRVKLQARATTRVAGPAFFFEIE